MKSQSIVPVNATLFANKVFADIQIKMRPSEAESRWRRNRTGDHFLFYKFIERTTNMNKVYKTTSDR